MATNHPSKQELREDRFVEWILETAEYVRARSQVFTAGAVGVVVLIAGLAYFNKSQADARLEAAALLGEAMIADDNNQADESIRLAEQLLKEYAGTPSAAQGVLFLANRYFAQGRYGEAQKFYERYLSDYGDVDVLAFAARNGLASCAEAQGDYRQAASKFQDAAAASGGNTQGSLALLEAARCYGLAGDTASQKGILTQITKEFSDSPAAVRAREELAML
ncbi:MAG: tetratricopeptide repeat protein [Candidatus Latescibacteria bacterium]|nr:tetratricopeptide repeat protein [Candidatus Latescibacterota bacterium]